MRISGCVICKNEQADIAICLESLQKIADEIIVVDTGSTDDTVKIAEAMGAIVHHFAWIDDLQLRKILLLAKLVVIG